MLNLENIPIQEIDLPILQARGIQLFIKREDLIHPEISGNKWRKLKWNIEKAQNDGKNTLLTFGGAYSNHIAATAAAGRAFQLNTIGIIRGQKSYADNPTLRKARNQGMQLHFIDRETYRRKDTREFASSLHDKFGEFYLIPEGGANALGAKGCMEILNNIGKEFNFICTPCGSGTTLAGLVAAARKHQTVLGFPAIKGGEYLEGVVNQLLKEMEITLQAWWKLIHTYHFGGFAKTDPEFRQFVVDFNHQTGIPLDYIYTGKMIYGILDLVENDHFQTGDKIIAIHTGGIQGNLGIEVRSMKNPEIDD